jgi:hypothetical protein
VRRGSRLEVRGSSPNPFTPSLSRGALFLLLLSGCANIELTTRTERGPLLRTFERPQVLPGGVKAEVRAAWPALNVSLVGYDTCRSQQVEEYAEETISERRATSVGPAVSMGLILTLGGAGLLALTPAFDNHPKTTDIDAGGRYGPSTQAYTLGVGVALASVGVPALLVGIIQALQTGEDVQTAKVEQVRAQRDVRCNDRPIDGPLELHGERGKVVQAVAKSGEASFAADTLGTEGPDGFKFYGKDVELDAASKAVLEGFFACGVLDKEAAPNPAELMTGVLVKRIERMRACRAVRPEGTKEQLDALMADLQRRRDAGERVMGPKATSWEDAVGGWAPRLRFADDSTDLVKLDNDEALVGQAALVEGMVIEGMTANIGVLRVGGREVFLYLPTDPPWGGDFPSGSKVEAVAVVAGRHTVGERTLPLLRAVWLRHAEGKK